MCAHGQIYKYKDQDGNTVFSDTRPPNAQPETVEEVELKAINSAQVQPSVKTTDSNTKREEQPKVVYNDRVSSPADGSTIPMGPGNFTVTATISPALASGERLQLLLDGAVTGAPQRGASWQLNNVFRGEHKLSVQRLGRSGDILNTSDTSVVYVLRPSIR
jgi:hypothetical protein